MHIADSFHVHGVQGQVEDFENLNRGKKKTTIYAEWKWAVKNVKMPKKWGEIQMSESNKKKWAANYNEIVEERSKWRNEITVKE